ncbi:MAG TPA: enoyl-CoA hydratase-related protein [Steroidobacteraceae bacterium]|jgi:2-(1,2-epoxy-1,2-dihydrophenyl)acetyl-CoA isomerase|nr:enoyl-CoA hydratase-related protein [Steroidobacteraceae bacterium]
MSAPVVQVDTRGAVALVTLNRPDSGNALNLQVAMDLLAAAMTCARNAAVRAVVLSGAGSHFCFGGDLRAFGTQTPGGDDYIRELTTYLHAAISQFVRMDPPVIAAVNGTAAGAGVGLVAMADLALCGRSSKFKLAYTQAGLTPDAGTTFLLPRMLGLKRTMELLLLNRSLAAEEAFSWGLVNEVVADEQLLPRALEIAEKLAHGASGAFGATKRLIAHSIGALESQMVLESETIARHAVGEEGREGIDAFLEKRKPRFPKTESR